MIDQISSSGGCESPSTATSTAKSSRRDSLTDKVVIPTQTQLQHHAVGQLQQQQHQQQQQPVPLTKAMAFEIPKSITSGSRNNR